MTDLPTGIWKVNLLPLLAVFYYHQWSRVSKGCFHCKRAHNHYVGEGTKFPLQRCLPTLHLDCFVPKDKLFPQKPLRCMNWGWNCSTTCLCIPWGPLVLHFVLEMVIYPSGWKAAFSSCVCRLPTQTLAAHLRAGAVNCRLTLSQ